MSYITFENVCKDYPAGDSVVHAADHVSFGIEKGELCVILGHSGAGKTTVLNLLGGMDRASSGRITVGDRVVTDMNDRRLTEYRRLDVGFVFQFYNLMHNLTALENVELAQQVCPNALNPAEVMRQVGLGDRMNNFPAQLSGGERAGQQNRRAGARAPDAPLPGLQHDGGHYHAQRRHCTARKPDHPAEKRHGAGGDRQRTSHPR